MTAGGCFAAQILNETKMQKISGFFDLIGLIPVDVLCERKQNRHDRNHACSVFIGSSFLTIDRFVSLLCRSGIKAVLSKGTFGRLKQQKTGFYNAVDKMDHFLFAVLVIALHNDMHQAV